MKDFKWGIIGCGVIAEKFAEAVNFSDGMSVAAAAARSLERAEIFAAKNNAARAYGSYAQMLETEELDAVYIATVNSEHYNGLKLCLERGLPALCEKPMLMTLNEFDEVAKLARDKNTPLMEAMWSDFIPSIVRAKSLLDSGELGKPILAELCFAADFKDDPNSRIFDPKLGGGLIYDIGVYNLHVALHLFGENYRDMAICGRKGPTGVDVASTVTFSYEGGPLVNTVTAHAAGPRDLNIYCEKGSINIEHFNDSQELTIFRQGAAPETVDCRYGCNGFEYEIAEFTDIVRRKTAESAVVSLGRSRRVCGIMERVAGTVR
jgi:predicted dehydrogenase